MTNSALYGSGVPVPRTWAVGDTLTASLMNTISYDLNWLLNPPLFRAHLTATQAPAASTWTAVSFATAGAVVDVDTANGWVAASATRYTCQYAGRYQIISHLS